MTPRNLFLAGTAALACGVFAGLAFSQVVPQPGPPTPIAGAFNTVPPTIPSGSAGWAQIDDAGNLKVNVAAGGASGGTSSTFGAAFPGTGTAVGFTDGSNMIAGTVDASGNLKVNCSAGCAGGSFNNNADNVATSATNGQSATWNYVWDGAAWDRLYGDSTNGLFANIKAMIALPAGTAIIGKVGIDQTTPGTTNLVAAGQTGTWTVQPGNTANTTPWLMSPSTGGNTAAVKAASTAPAATDPALVVAISPNSVNANGQATMANSAPVVIASNQSAIPVSAASGSYASGAFASGSFASGSHASGSFASGAFASGSVASGALASGSIASGAMVDLGAQADSACSTDNGTCSAIALIKRTNQRLTTVNTSIGAANAYETVAASQTGQSLGATGATGDYLSHCVIYPVTTSPGVVTVFDNTNAAGSNAIAFAGGATSVSNLAPIAVPVGAISTAGAWKVTTGANVIVTCYGRFT